MYSRQDIAKGITALVGAFSLGWFFHAIVMTFVH
jgi:hypothetical protein